jgi:hypothetical protein
MKTRFFKVVMPLAVVAVALAGAVSTSAMEKSAAKSGAIMGWKHTVSNPCVQDIECNARPGFACTALDGSQLYAKPGVTCPTPLTRDFQ